MRRKTNTCTKKLVSVFAVLLFLITNQHAYATFSISTKTPFNSSSHVFDFQSTTKNTRIHEDTIYYPKKVKDSSSSSPQHQTWSMNLDGTNRKVLLEGSFAKNIIPYNGSLYYMPTTPSLDQYSLGLRRRDLSTAETSWIFEDSIANFQIFDGEIYCVKEFSGFYLRCNCQGKQPDMLCQKSTYRYIFKHNHRTFVFEDTPYQYNVSKNFQVSLLDSSSNSKQVLSNHGYNYITFQDNLYYINVVDQKIYQTSLTTLESTILSDIQATNMRLDEHYIYFVNCEMGLLRPEYNYYRMDHSGQNITYICPLKDIQLPLGVNEKSYHIIGKYLVEIADRGKITGLKSLPYGGIVRLVTKDAVYYTYSLDATSENTEMGIFKISSE
jgi:hypothetical protein